MAAVALFCGCGSGSYNPTPAITGLFPNAVTAGSQSFTLYLNGNGFQVNTTVQWNGVDRPAVFNKETDQLAVTILAGDVANAGSGQLTVTNPAPGGGLNPAAAPLVSTPPAANGPTITTLKPGTGVAGSHSDVTLNVTGKNLFSNYVIAINGTALNTTAVEIGRAHV